MKWLVRGGECHGECQIGHSKLTGKKRKERGEKEKKNEIPLSQDFMTQEKQV